MTLITLGEFLETQEGVTTPYTDHRNLSFLPSSFAYTLTVDPLHPLEGVSSDFTTPAKLTAVLGRGDLRDDELLRLLRERLAENISRKYDNLTSLIQVEGTKRTNMFEQAISTQKQATEFLGAVRLYDAVSYNPDRNLKYDRTEVAEFLSRQVDLAIARVEQ